MSAAELDLHSLRLVQALADHGTMTAAAAFLGFSQPAVSQQIKRLERQLDLAIIEHVGRSIRLTEAGRVLADHAPRIAQAVDAAQRDLARLRELKSGRVRLVGFPSASPTIVPRLLAQISARYPGIHLSYQEAEPPDAVAAVRADKADIALTFSYNGDPGDPHADLVGGLAVEDVGWDELYLVLPAGHALRANRRLSLSLLARDSWIAGCPLCRGHLLRLCLAEGFHPHIAFETDNFFAATSMVATGIGVALIPSLALTSVGVRPGVLLRPTEPGLRRSLHLVCAPDAARAPAIALTISVFGQLSQRVSAGSNAHTAALSSA